MEAQRAAMRGRSAHPQAIQSYEPEGAVMSLVVEADEDAAHEAHVGVEVVCRAHAGIEVRSRARENQIGLSEYAAEVSNDGGIVARVRAGRRTGVNRTREEEVCTGWGGDVRNRPRNSMAFAMMFFVLVIVICKR